MCCRFAYGNGEGEVEDHQGRRNGTSHCEAETTVGVSEDESTEGWKEKKIGAYASGPHLIPAQRRYENQATLR